MVFGIVEPGGCLLGLYSSAPELLYKSVSSDHGLRWLARGKHHKDFVCSDYSRLVGDRVMLLVLQLFP